MTTSIELYDRVWEAAREACAPGAAADDWPVMSGATPAVLGGPEGARLVIRPRLDGAGCLTGAAWQGCRADGSAIHGHGGLDAAVAAAAEWAAGLDDEPVITPAELRARREATGASQADLARLLGTSQGVVSQWETGARAPRDPDEVAGAVARLETIAEDLYQATLAAGALEGRLPVWATDRDYWAADPVAARQGTPAAMQRVAAARAARALTERGTRVRLLAGQPHTGAAPGGGR